MKKNVKPEELCKSLPKQITEFMRYVKQLDFEQDPTPCAKGVKDLCNQYDITCHIDYNNDYFYQHPELFYDNEHVNKDGAELYSRLISSRLKQLTNPDNR